MPRVLSRLPRANVVVSLIHISHVELEVRTLRLDRNILWSPPLFRSFAIEQCRAETLARGFQWPQNCTEADLAALGR